MFLYRDEVYNPDTEFPSLCDIILAKYRHGPTSTGTVYFKKDYGEFVDLEIHRTQLNDHIDF